MIDPLPPVSLNGYQNSAPTPREVLLIQLLYSIHKPFMQAQLAQPGASPLASGLTDDLLTAIRFLPSLATLSFTQLQELANKRRAKDKRLARGQAGQPPPSAEEKLKNTQQILKNMLQEPRA